MRIPKNTSVPVQLDMHRPAVSASDVNSRTPKNSGCLHTCNSAQQLQQQLQQLQPVRTVYINQQEFDQIFQFRPPARFSWRRLSRRLCCSYFYCLRSADHFLRFLLSFLPILQWLPSYSLRDNLAGDLMAGMTVGVVHVPQGIAYAILAGLDPVHGLYTSFFAVLFYMLFGTSRHISIGSFAILSLMTGVSCRDIYAQLDKEFLESEMRMLDDATLRGGDIMSISNMTRLIPRMEVEYSELVQAITLTAGFIQIAMAVLRVEFLASYLSDQLVNGFCTGAAVHVVGVQLGKLFQLDLGKIGGPGYLYLILRNLVLKLPQMNPLAVGLSAVSFVFLYLGKDTFGPKLRRLIPVVLPFELILVMLATGLSSFAGLRDSHNITVLNKVPTGLPVVRLPRLELLPYVFGDALEIAFVSVALHLSMCKVLNRRMNTKTDNNLELYALGILHSLSSCFTTYPVTTVLGRSLLNVECGAKTQLTAVFSALLLLIVIFFLGPLLSSLPVCILAVIIIYSMKSAFQKMPREFVHLWRVSKIDFLIWVVTIIATVVLNVMQGLALSVTFALLTTVFRIQWPRWHLLSNLTGTENYRDSGRYGRVTPLGHGIRIFRFDAPLLFTNVDHFANSAMSAITMPTSQSTMVSNNFDTSRCGDVQKCNGNGNGQLLLVSSVEQCSKQQDHFRQQWHLSLDQRVRESGVKSLIVDCTGFTFVDYTSINALADLYHQLTDLNVNVLFAGAKAPVRDMLELCQFFNSVPKEQFYPTIHDCVLAASNKKKWVRRKRGFSDLSLKKSPAAQQEDTNSLCVGENELYQWSFKQTLSDTQLVIHEEEEGEENAVDGDNEDVGFSMEVPREIDEEDEQAGIHMG